MFKVFEAILRIIWVFDIINLPFMEALDTTYPINTLAWFLIWALLPTGKKEDKTTWNKDL